MSKATKARHSAETYNKIYKFIDNDVSDVAMLPDGTSLVKVNTRELIKNYAIQLTVAKMNGMSPSQQPTPIDPRKREESETQLTREKIARETCRSRNDTLKRGRKTKTMTRQLREFLNYLKEKPVSPDDRSCTIGARAAQYWRLHKAEMERSAQERGERRGYLNPRCLADGARKVFRKHMN